MSHIIQSVDRGSPAARAGIRAMDRLLTINGKNIIDFLDYQSLCANRRIRVRILRDGEAREYTIVKGEYQSLGLNFSTPMMSEIRMCCNKCLFCFVDQLPRDVRPSLRIKDDDWRTSLMFGSYVTLTNVSDRELDRIIALHASPLYISVHAVDPELRSRLLGTPRGAMLMDQLHKLSDGGIEFHCQSVLCPGINDGPALEETIEALCAIPGALSLALVPVGLTNHRDGLTDLRKYTVEEARAVLEMADRWRERLLREKGTRFVFPSDEFYLQAGLEVPADETYEDYGQIDDGVGLLRLLDTEFSEAWEALDPSDRRDTGGKKLAIACGVSAAPFLTDLMERHPVTGAEVTVYPVVNTFFGSNVTVSGLITGQTLVDAMRGVDCEAVLITECMLRDQENCFLDDLTLEDAISRLGRPIVPVGRHGEDLLQAILENRESP